MGCLATASRMLWAFARENGIPFHRFVSKVRIPALTRQNEGANPGHQIMGKHPLPLIAIFVTATINACLALINIGSTAAFNAFTSLTVSSSYISFTLAAGCLLWRKLTRQPLKYGPFTLGRAEIPLLIYSIAYSIVGAFFAFWPQAPKPSAQSMNWAVVVVSGTLIGSLVYWFIWGRKTYTGPIIEVSLDGDQQIREVK